MHITFLFINKAFSALTLRISVRAIFQEKLCPPYLFYGGTRMPTRENAKKNAQTCNLAPRNTKKSLRAIFFKFWEEEVTSNATMVPITQNK